MINVKFIFLSQLKFTNLKDIFKKIEEINAFSKIKSVSIYLLITFFFYLTIKKHYPLLTNGEFKKL